MKIIDFKFLSNIDSFDNRFDDGFAWSRPYEYDYVFKTICEFKGVNNTPKIHNSSWGFEGIHVKFKELLDNTFGKGAIHSDIKPSMLDKTFVYDITQTPPEELKNNFDFVINISTFEEVGFDQIKIFENLYLQVRESGYLILTFDYPGFELNRFEDYLGFKINRPNENLILNPKNSVVKNISLGDLNVGVLTVKKD